VVTFTTAAIGFPLPSFQWQVSTNGGSTWANLTNTSSVSGATTTTLTIAPATVYQTGHQCRVLATNSIGTDTSQTATLTVTIATPVITWANPASIPSGTALGAAQLNATAGVAGAFYYGPPAGTVLNKGLKQTLSVTFIPSDTANYTTATKTVTIDVTNMMPVVTWANPASIVYGTAIGATQLNATANVAGTFVYAPASGTVLGAGTGQVLSVTFTPTDTANYATAIKTVTIDVTKTMPEITWASPASMAYGGALGVTQLNATANVAGSFIYGPPAGTVLYRGTG
jgi:hypothetical protein